MNLSDRQKLFLDAAQSHFETVKPPRELFGVSNSAKIIEGGIQLGIVNLNSVRDDVEGIAFACVMRFPPEDEVYFSVLIKKDKVKLLSRLADMKRIGAAIPGDNSDIAGTNDEDLISQTEIPGTSIRYNTNNNNVAIYIARDGKLWIRNKGFWDSLDFDRTGIEPSIAPDQIVVALYPPTASARRSLLAREFIGWLGTMVGHDKIHELIVWTDAVTLGTAMQRMPSTIPIGEIEAAIAQLGGHYPNGEVRRFHAALNFLSHKHFVILSGLSGTGKTQLALKYARAIHGLTTNSAADPLVFECAVRPEWTDPSGLTGYYDVLTNRYVVPTFLEAVLVATAHRSSPVFVILDEMNLARVEYYLSDVLSCIETQSALQLHSNSVPLEGTTGSSIRAELPLPPNLFIIGTINVDETTNPVSDKVLDRASVIDMSTVDVMGFLALLEAQHPELKSACAATAPKLTEIHELMQLYGLGFGYRVIEEMVRYHNFDALYIQSTENDVTDQLLVQKVLVKLRGAEKQRSLLSRLEKAFNGFPRSQTYVQRLLIDLEDFGSFQAMR
jgi:MoxR-like ATPase